MSTGRLITMVERPVFDSDDWESGLPEFQIEPDARDQAMPEYCPDAKVPKRISKWLSGPVIDCSEWLRKQGVPMKDDESVVCDASGRWVFACMRDVTNHDLVVCLFAAGVIDEPRATFDTRCRLEETADPSRPREAMQCRLLVQGWEKGELKATRKGEKQPVLLWKVQPILRQYRTKTDLGYEIVFMSLDALPPRFEAWHRKGDFTFSTYREKYTDTTQTLETLAGKPCRQTITAKVFWGFGWNE